MSRTIIVGYSGHAYVAIEVAKSQGVNFDSYCDQSEKGNNPYTLEYLGQETEEMLSSSSWFVGIGNNKIRKIILEKYRTGQLLTCIHSLAIVSSSVEIGEGTLIAAGSIVNSQAKIGKGVICNTGSIIEHECNVGSFAHIAPGAVLAGNVTVGASTFVWANSVVKEGVKIGKNVIIGAGTVIINNEVV